MTAFQAARRYLSAGVPVPLDLAFDLLAQGVDPDKLQADRGDQPWPAF
jgi:hypothetical protein